MTADPAALPPWLSQTATACIVTAHVQPGARGSGVVGEHGDALKIRIDSPPIDGRANLALIAFLADRLGLAKSALSVVSGESSRRKRIQVCGLTAGEILQRLARPS